MKIAKAHIFELDFPCYLGEILSSFMNRGWSEHNFSNFVDVDEKFVEISVHATKKEQGTQKL